jgi:hypothetical protein
MLLPASAANAGTNAAQETRSDKKRLRNLNNTTPSITHLSQPDSRSFTLLFCDAWFYELLRRNCFGNFYFWMGFDEQAGANP